MNLDYQNDRQNDRRNDDGFTLVETLVVVLLVALLGGVLSAAIIVVLRSEDGVARVVAESHDLQQAVNYFPSDIGVAPTAPAAFSTSGTPTCGSGHNVMSVAYPSGTAVSYVLPSSTPTRLDRVTCSGLTTLSTTNVADLLDPDATPAASTNITIVDGVVTEVVLSLARSSATDLAEVIGIPRGVELLADADTIGGNCNSDDPIEETSGFLTFVEGDIDISGAQIYKAFGAGGVLTFDNSQAAGHGGNNTYVPASVGVYAGSVDWANSSGTLRVLGSPNAHVVLTDAVDGIDYDYVKQGNPKYLYAAGSTSEPRIEMQGGQIKQPNPGHTIEFPAAFTELRSCSEAMAQLPNSCNGCAAHVVPLHINANSGNLIPYNGTGNLKLDLTPGKTNVLNISETRLRAIGAITPAYLDVNPNAVDSLVINVIDDDPTNDRVEAGEPVSVVEMPNPMQFQNYTTKVIWNFAGIDEVELPNGIWGTVYAPASHVTVGNNVQGNLIASSTVITGGVVNEANSFNGVVRWS